MINAGVPLDNLHSSRVSTFFQMITGLAVRKINRAIVDVYKKEAMGKNIVIRACVCKALRNASVASFGHLTQPLGPCGETIHSCCHEIAERER